MGLATVVFECGHKLKDNGVGDYELVCPDHGVQAWLHVGQVMDVVLRQTICLACSQPIGKMTADSPMPYQQGKIA